MLGLARRRDAQIEGGAQRHGHGSSLLMMSLFRPEQFVEDIAEPPLEQIDLGLADGDMLRPVVGDDPVRQLVLRLRAAPIRPHRRRREAVVIEIECGSVQVIGRGAVAPATDAGTMGALSRHARRIARMGRRLNDAILRHSPLRSGG
jgi:hypothetical protein